MKNSAKVNEAEIPYLHKQYNIIDQEPGSGVVGLNRWIFPLVEVLNEKKRLPKLLLVMPDKDLIHYLINRDMSSSIVIGASLHYIIKQMDMYISRQQQGILLQKPGALMRDEFPKIIWIRMMKRPNLKSPAAVSTFAMHGKFNSILEERLHDGNADNHFIMSIKVTSEEYDMTGNLTSTGKANFWKEVNRGLECFDKNQISLKPRNYKKAPASTPSLKVLVKSSMKKPAILERRKLPTPPPTAGGKEQIKNRSSRSRSPHHKQKKSSTKLRSRS